jgi:FkbM family methyltransferase
MLGRFLLDLFGRSPDASLAAGNPSAPANPAHGTASEGVLTLDRTNSLVKGRHGWFLANRNDRYLGAALIRYGEYGEIEHRLLNSLISPGDDVIEVGANIGSHTVGLAKAVGDLGSVIAVEPQEAIYRVLCANLALNGLANVKAHCCGCGAGRTTLIVPARSYDPDRPHNSGSVSLASGGEGQPVAVLPLDELAGDVRRLRLLKIDVEGMEREVLQGGQGLIARHRPALYVENDIVDKSKALIEHIRSADYKLWWHVAFLFNPDNFFGIAENDYPTAASFNMLCLPNEAPDAPADDFLLEITDADYHPLAR